MVLRWNDAYKTKTKKIVSTMSTKHTGVLKETGKINHASKEPVRKPDVIVAYNQTMGGVENLSRVLVPNGLARRGVKWYRKLAEVFIDFAIYNSFIVWKKINNSKKTHFQFRDSLVNAIIMFHLNDKGPSCPGHSSKAGLINYPLRLIGKHFLSKNPATLFKNTKRRKCVRCTAMHKRTDSAYRCMKCNVTLCMEPCFEIYHTRKQFTSDIPVIDDTTSDDDGDE